MKIQREENTVDKVDESLKGENSVSSGSEYDYEDSLFTRIQKMLHREKEKFAGMNKKQRWSYFKTYYMIYAIITVLLLCCLVWFLYDVVFSQKNVLYSGGMMGCDVSESGRKYLTDEFLTYLGGREGKDSVELSENLWIAFSQEDVEEYQAMYNNIYVNIAAGDFSYMFLDKAMVSQIANLDTLVNLEEFRSDFHFEEDELYRCENGQAVGILLEPSVMKKLQMTSVTGEVYLVFVDVMRDPEKDEMFLKYIFENE